MRDDIFKRIFVIENDYSRTEVSLIMIFTVMDPVGECCRQASNHYSPGAKMGTWRSLRVQGFMIDPESIGVLKKIKLCCHDGNLGGLFYLHNS